ncbi:Fe-S cluster assembly protein SufB [Candidatus Woesearchaeota archaeon]|nr:Fe-S cluster assembly protein SufB [Candidatus Woesearchaeota archaeon]
MTQEQEFWNIESDYFEHKVSQKYELQTPPGLTEEVIRQISKDKNEPQWMLDFRLKCFELFKQLPMPNNWPDGPDLKDLDLTSISYYIKPGTKTESDWEKVPPEIKKTFERLGIPEAERRSLAGAGAQFESEVVYHNLKKQWEDLGVIFTDCDVALKEHPELFKKYFMKCVPPTLHKFAALHGACWSGGTFIMVPKGVKVDLPLQAYFRMNVAAGGQFEHTLIIVDEGAEVSYVEGCSSPSYMTGSLHAGCVEIFVHKGARGRYTSMENWSRNVFNLNTKRAIVEDDGLIEWINGNAGSHITMLYPCSILKGKNARSDFLGIAVASKGQYQDTGAKVYHLAPNTTSTIRSKSISKDGGITTYRGLVKIAKNATNAKVHVQCDALMLDNQSKSNTVPYMDVDNKTAEVGHEATVAKIGDEQLFYLMSRGLSEEEARKMIVLGFVEPITKALPIEYAVEFNKLIELEMENALG